MLVPYQSRWLIIRLTVLALVVLGLPPWAQTALGQSAETQPGALAADAILAGASDAKTDAARREAMIQLLDSSNPKAIQLLKTELRPGGNPVMQRAIAQAVILGRVDPPPELAPDLFKLFDQADDGLLTDLATALGRYRDYRLAQKLISVALDEAAPINRRRGAAQAIAPFPSQNGARVLMQLIVPGNPGITRRPSSRWGGSPD